MDGYRALLSELFLGLVNLTDEVDEALARLGDALLRPVSELELSDGPALAISSVRHLGRRGESCYYYEIYFYLSSLERQSVRDIRKICLPQSI